MNTTANRVDSAMVASAFLLGVLAVAWTGANFLSTDALAFTVTVVIGGVYTIGAVELLKYRQATTTLSRALDATQGGIDDFGQWLGRLDPSLRNAVRMRVEGDSAGLPAPILTPYLVGLLVMLGLLGTFAGLAGTLRGAVAALEGTTELQAIRQGLAAPINGLGVAFGTSVAGVATSAMLGLMSTLCRRRRMLETRRLDTCIPVCFQPFSLIHSQRETFRALQQQTRSLPAVVDRLESLAGRLDQMGRAVVDNQERFHQSAALQYERLAAAIDLSLKETLSANMRLVGETVTPIVEGAMQSIVRETRSVHSSLGQITREALDQFDQRLETAVATHLTALGRALEAPMRRLIETASEAPRAAADLVEQMRRETARQVHRDNRLLEERRRVMAQLEMLDDTLKENLSGQCDAIERLVAASAESLQAVGRRFDDRVTETLTRLSVAAENVAVNGVQMASLGESFSEAVDLFNESNHMLVDNLSRIEETLEKTTARSDDQLGYVVAQAREIIEYAMLSQKEVFDALGRVNSEQGMKREAN